MDHTVIQVARLFTAVFIAGVPTGIFTTLYCQKNGHNRLAIFGFVACVFSGLVGGLVLAVPMSAIFCYVSKSKKSKVSQATTSAPDSDIEYIAKLLTLKNTGALNTDEFEKLKTDRLKKAA